MFLFLILRNRRSGNTVFFCNEEFYHIRQNFLVLSHLRKKFYLEYDFYFSWAKKNLVGNGREKREERKGILVY
ncbi:ssr6079 (plasmid) [Synechocystis sp. PCC 6803]|uniref:Ssr6020 protein n=1 Tax=Synechocystis sp. (strain ATCC 27184 / PCC 6803 / Kazusa) TaxID=1111708 RepID=Q6YRS5_SYNY3|nr:hypothetical protein MYO_3210 [Synechocystis sp. PCC 6803]AVP91702.1 hypothetical protein C7I86_18215 [Synechocystis sp. IPPAS B-1465]AGF53788.1 hypothetical protein MYO_3800 [Synechocystis sp. PCC 6803]AVP91758.1 hypothetical protein C7I86_18500 [Synechocystis sp. IPPAS B-1465]MCW5242040.1 hypothetical protein [Synechocystis sp. PCC 6803]